MSDTNTIKKPERKFSKKIYAVRMHPPSLLEGETEGNPQPMVHFLTERSKAMHFKCTKDVYRRVEGKPRPKAPHPGMDKRSDMEFVIGVDEKDRVTSVDTMPKRKKLMHNVGRVDAPSDTVQLTVAYGGQIDIKAIPEYVTTKGMIRIIQLLDAVTEIKPGMMLGGKHEVMSVAGNRVEIEFADVEAAED